jgi:hypothetical protein
MTDSALRQFAQDLRQDVLAKTGDEANPRLREEAFTEYVLEVLTDHNEAFDWELCFHQAKAARRLPAARLNAWSLSGDGATLDLFVTLHHDSDETAEIGKPEVRRHFDLLRGFLRRALAGMHAELEESSDAFRATLAIYEARTALTTVRLFFLTDGLVRSLDIDESPVGDLEVRYVVWDLEKLSQLHVGSREEIALDFANDYGGALPCLLTTDSLEEYKTYLAFMPATLLAQIYGTYGQRLLERNVRAFLQSKGKVNRGLQKTLKEEPHRFLAYNNGLCCTAAEVRITAAPNGHGLLEWARDFQVVNGGQTTASIYHATKKDRVDISRVAVQVKLTVLNDPEAMTEIVPLIAKYANSQNKVNGADLAANGKFHRDLEALSRTVWTPAASGLERGDHWYYERARGSYQDDKARQATPARMREWGKQNPTKRKFTKTDLAKFEHAWLGLPHLVCRGAEKNFKEFADRMENDGEPVVDLEYFHRAIAKAILWRSAEGAFDSLRLQGYRANSVAYAIAWLAERSARRIDLTRIWSEQDISPALRIALEVVIASAHRYLNSRTGNVGEASKKVECWSTFREKSIVVDAAWERELNGCGEAAAVEKGTTREQDVAIAEVKKFPAEYWYGLSKWAREHSFLQPWQRSLSYSMGRLASRGKSPTGKQAVQALKLIERAKELGFGKSE